MRWQWYWRSAVIVVMVITSGWIGYRYFGLAGDVTLTYKFNRTDGFISEFTPHGRALDREQNSQNGDFYQRLVGEPAYFSVQLPSAYPTMDVTLEYQNPNQLLVNLGLQLSDDPTLNSYQFKTIENKFIDGSKWSRLETDQYVLLQKVQNYSSIEDFWANPPAGGRIGTTLPRLPVGLRDTSYQSSGRRSVITVPLQARQDISTYIKNEPLDITFSYQQLPDLIGNDLEFTALVLSPTGETIWSQLQPAPTQQLQQLHIYLDHLPEGAYRIQLNTSDTALFRKVESAQDRLVWNSGVRIADVPTDPVTIYTNADYVNLRANSPTGLGDIVFYDRTVPVPTVSNLYTWENPIPFYQTAITIPVQDFSLFTQGSFSFTPEQWFDANFGFSQITEYSQPDQFSYIIAAPYDFPTQLRGWTTTTQTYDLTKVNRAVPTQLTFMLSAPGLERQPQGIKVRSISVTAHKDPVTWSNLWTRLSDKLFQ